MPSYQYRKSHCGDKTVVRSSYLHNGISYTGKMSSLYWIGAQVSIRGDIGLLLSGLFQAISRKLSRKSNYKDFHKNISGDAVCKMVTISPRPKCVIIAQVYGLSAAHCQVTWYSQRVPGYNLKLHTLVLCVSQWNLFWQKISQSDCAFQLTLGQEKIFSLSTWWLQRAFWRLNWSIIQNMTLKYDLFFQMASILSLKCKFASLLCW